MRTIINEEVIFFISLSTKNANGKYGYRAGFLCILTGLYDRGFNYGNMIGKKDGRQGNRNDGSRSENP